MPQIEFHRLLSTPHPPWTIWLVVVAFPTHWNNKNFIKYMFLFIENPYRHSNTALSPSFASTGLSSCKNSGATSATSTFNGASVRALPDGFWAWHRMMPPSASVVDKTVNRAHPSGVNVWRKCASFSAIGTSSLNHLSSGFGSPTTVHSNWADSPSGTRTSWRVRVKDGAWVAVGSKIEFNYFFYSNEFQIQTLYGECDVTPHIAVFVGRLATIIVHVVETSVFNC